MIFFKKSCPRLASPRSHSAVGFIGLGNMGRGMAKNLLDKGNQVVAYDTNGNTMAEAVKLGVVVAKSPNEVFYVQLDWIDE